MKTVNVTEQDHNSANGKYVSKWSNKVYLGELSADVACSSMVHCYHDDLTLDDICTLAQVSIVVLSSPESLVSSCLATVSSATRSTWQLAWNPAEKVMNDNWNEWILVERRESTQALVSSALFTVHKNQGGSRAYGLGYLLLLEEWRRGSSQKCT